MTEAELARTVDGLPTRQRQTYQFLTRQPMTKNEIHRALGRTSRKVSVEEIGRLESMGLVRSRRSVRHGRNSEKLWEIVPAAEVEAHRKRTRSRGVRVVQPEFVAFQDLEVARRVIDGSFTEWEHTQTRMVMLSRLLVMIKPKIWWRAASDDLPETARWLVRLIEWAAGLLAEMDVRWADDITLAKIAKARTLAQDIAATDGEREAAKLAAERLERKLAS
jgi:hypothetical protein